MAELKKIYIPNIGDFDSVEVIEIMVKVGDKINIEDSLITVESDKASMDIPSPASGLIKSLDIKVGDEVKEGSLILSIDSEIEDTSEVKAPEKKNKPLKRKRLSPHLKMKKVMKNMMLLF
jgi:pyruvate/2-oxoglutarate dehydrogenase complex dihydrolipoamide acyltransferase (E2) component